MAEQIGFVGLGVMGGAIASRIRAAGHEMVVYSRTSKHVESLAAAGATAVTSAAQVAERTDIVFSCLLDDDAVEQVYLGANGLLSRAREGQIFVEHGTFSPALARRIALKAGEAGAAFLDAPVSGGPEGAATGNLVAMIAGSADGADAIAPVLQSYTKDTVYVGGSGAALELKLINQLLVVIHVAAAAEAALVLRKLALEPEVATRVLNSGWGASVMLARCLPPALGGPSAPLGATIAALHEQRDMIFNLAAESDSVLRLFPAASQLLTISQELGFGGRDLSAVVEALELIQPKERET